MNRRAFLRTLCGRDTPAAQGPALAGDQPDRAPAPAAEPTPVRALAKAYGLAANAVFGGALAEPDYMALLPPDFTPDLLRLEAERLGLNPAVMGRQELARAVLRVMGALPQEAEA